MRGGKTPSTGLGAKHKGDPGQRGLEDFSVSVAVGGFAGLFVIILVILFCGPEFCGGNYLSFYIVTHFLKLLHEIFSDLFLLLGHIKNHRAILRADIGALTVYLSEIVGFKEQLCEFLEIGFRRVKDDLDGLSVACPVGADLLVCRIIELAARVTDRC